MLCCASRLIMLIQCQHLFQNVAIQTALMFTFCVCLPLSSGGFLSTLQRRASCTEQDGELWRSKTYVVESLGIVGSGGRCFCLLHVKVTLDCPLRSSRTSDSFPHPPDWLGPQLLFALGVFFFWTKCALAHIFMYILVDVIF